MWLRMAAMAAVVFALCDSALAQAPEQLSLDGAFARVAQSHPELRLFGAQHEVLAAEMDRASLRPPLVAGAELENVAGTDEASDFQSAELTLTLASILERGGKLDARRTLAQSRIDALAVERETRRLDLLAEVARRYLAVVAASHQRQIAELDIAQRTRTVAGARQRLQAGASPESVVLTAQAALARAELDRERANQRRLAARQHLAALWGERDPDFDIVSSDPLRLPAVADFSALSERLERTPELAQFADERRIREARLQLARSRGQRRPRLAGRRASVADDGRCNSGRPACRCRWERAVAPNRRFAPLRPNWRRWRSSARPRAFRCTRRSPKHTAATALRKSR